MSARKSHPEQHQRGMTLIELSITLGIVSVLFAMALGLARHTEAITKIRRAQADLALWHEALSRWHVQFGEYPCFDMSQGAERSDNNSQCVKGGANAVHNLAKTVSNACARIEMNGGAHYEYFSQYITGAPTNMNALLTDPWGKPYIYIPADDDPDDTNVNPRTTYRLFSCGPDLKTHDLGHDPRTEYDDVYFE